MSGSEPHDQGHLSAEDVAAYLDRRLTAAARDRVEAHLAWCKPCRDEVVELVRLRRPEPRRRRWYILAPAAAAAAALIVVTLGRSRPAEAPGGTTRAATLEGIERFDVVRPVPNSTVSADAREFVWRSVGANATYRITITDPSGGLVWSGTIQDTAVTPSGDIALRPGQGYFWYVDALLPDGRSANTGVKEFRTGP